MKKLTIVLTILGLAGLISAASITQDSYMPSFITYNDVNTENATYTYTIYNSSMGVVSLGNYTYGVNLSENLSEGDYSIEIVKIESFSFTVNNILNDPEQVSNNEPLYFNDGNVILNTTYSNFYENTIIEHSLKNMDTNETHLTNYHISFDYNGSYYITKEVPNASVYYYSKDIYYANGTLLGTWANPVYVYQE